VRTTRTIEIFNYVDLREAPLKTEEIITILKRVIGRRSSKHFPVEYVETVSATRMEYIIGQNAPEEFAHCRLMLRPSKDTYLFSCARLYTGLEVVGGLALSEKTTQTNISAEVQNFTDLFRTALRKKR